MSMGSLMLFIYTLTFSLFSISGCTLSENNSSDKIPPCGTFSPPDPGTSTVSLKIDKSEYTLTLLYDDKAIKEYPVVFGFNALDDKRKEGDGCTPEGIFHIRSKYHHKSWSRFMWIDYPTADSWKKHKASKASGEIESTASIGGEIGIHGVPEGLDGMIQDKDNWTLGCISLRNCDVNEIYDVIGEGAEVEIVK